MGDAVETQDPNYDAAVEDGAESEGSVVTVRGSSRADVVEALKLLDAARMLQAEHVTLVYDDLVKTSLARQVSLIPPASYEQARRFAATKSRLLSTPVWSHKTLSEVREDTSVGATRTWVSRAQDRHELFVVKLGGKTVIPSFQTTETGAPRLELRPLLQHLGKARIDGWTTWVWLTSRTPLLSGDVPEQVAASKPQQAADAAARFASRNRARG